MRGPINFTLIRSWLYEAGKIALKYRRSPQFRLKADGTLVTPVDLQIESFLINRIREHYPAHAILSEESGIIGKSDDWTWIIDPLDGTRAYASGLPIWGISIGLFHHHALCWGAFYLPLTDEMIWGNGNSASYAGHKLTNVHSLTPSSPTAFVAVPSDFHQAFSIDFPRLRSFGSTAAHLAFVARDVALATIAHHVSLWDLAGLMPVFAATGVDMRYLSGRLIEIDDLLDGKKLPEAIIAAPAPLMETIRGLVHIH
jgi:fructose-1,6-bisphosphatase/inositol monophosphatase family enzyme